MCFGNLVGLNSLLSWLEKVKLKEIQPEIEKREKIFSPIHSSKRSDKVKHKTNLIFLPKTDRSSLLQVDRDQENWSVKLTFLEVTLPP